MFAKQSSSSSSSNKRSLAADSPQREDKTYKSPIGFEKKRKKDDVIVSTTEPPIPSDRTERKKKRRKVKDKRKAGDKFCVRIPEDLDDSKRLITLNEIIFEHVQNNYCKAPIVEETEKYSQEIVKPNFENDLNRMKEQMYSKMISQLEKELLFWENVSENLENDQHMVDNLAKIKAEENELDQSSRLEPIISGSSNLMSLVDSAIEGTSLGVDKICMLGEGLKQMAREAKHLQEQVFNQINVHRQSANPSKSTSSVVTRILQATGKSEKKETNLFDPKSIIGEKDY